MEKIGSAILTAAALLVGLTACQHRPFLTGSIHEDQSLFVRLAVDQTVGGGHSHPASMTAEEMTTVLSGIIVEELSSLMPSVPLPGKDKEPPRRPAFRMEEIALLAPLLAKGLNTARPEEVVTFYWITQQPAPIEHVTSGGVFIDGDHLHFLLSNYRSPTRYPPDAETMQSLDGRSTPLQPLVPQETLLSFNPITALVPLEQEFLKNPFRSKRREIIVLFRTLPEDTVRKSH
jgi:hypothetical protein